jgi:hypothetical protein
VKNSHIFDLGAGGVRIGLDDVSEDGCRDNSVLNNLIEDGGYVCVSPRAHTHVSSAACCLSADVPALKLARVCLFCVGASNSM